jgi:hypothetical protein
MALTPVEGYHSGRRRPGRSAKAATALLLATGDEELPDVRLSVEDRELVKRVIEQLEQRLGVDGLMFAAAGCEAAAVRKRASEEVGRA